jgi:DNA repair photolyase
MAMRIINDRLHSQVAKGHRPEQVQIDAIQRGVGKLAFGGCTVQEMTAQSALTDFTMGDMHTGLAWSINPYVGCLHRCTYCFVPNTLHVERKRWGTYVIVKHNLPSILRRELEEKPELTVFISTSTDPYQPIEAERRITRSCLRLLARKDWPVDILTRSPLVLRDMDVLKRFSRLRVGLSVPTLDEEARRVIEPNAPPIAKRLEALRTLADEGFTTYANYTPAYPLSGGYTADDVASTFKKAGAKWVNTSQWKFQATYLAGMFDALKRTEWAGLSKFVGNNTRQGSLRRDLDRAFDKVGLSLRTGFFNEPMSPMDRDRVKVADLSRFGSSMVTADRPCS